MKNSPNPFRFYKSAASLVVALFALNIHVSATLTDGSLAPDFTLDDINGNSFNLYSALNNGKTVIIEFAATWDENSWNYHNTQSLQQLHLMHGTGGSCSEDVIIIMIEADPSTGSDDLSGSSLGSQGNWLSGITYPVFNPTGDEVMTSFLVSEFPTIYRICPSKVVQSNGMLSTAGHIASIESCGLSNDIAINDVSAFVHCSDVNLEVRIANITSATLTGATIEYAIDGGESTEFNWSGTIDPGTFQDVAIYQGALTQGLHNISCSISNGDVAIVDMNGTNDCISFSVNVIDPTGNGIPYQQTFVDDTFPYANWSVDNPDNSITWQRIDAPDSVVLMNCYAYADAGQSDYLIMEPLDLTQLSNPQLSFDIAYAPYDSSFYDGLRILVSGDCGENWSEVFFAEGTNLATAGAMTEEFIPAVGQWGSKCIDLTAYAGLESALIAFDCENGWGNNLYLDNIQVGQNCITDVNDNIIGNDELTFYPNPANDLVTLQFSKTISESIEVSLCDVSGKIQMTEYRAGVADSDNVIQLNISALAQGYYFVRVVSEDHQMTGRLIVK